MMRGNPTPPLPCRQCSGTGIYRADDGPTACTSCNGTGIHGDPRGVLAVFALCLIFWITVVVILT